MTIYDEFFGPFLRGTVSNLSSGDDREISEMIREMKCKAIGCISDNDLQQNEKGALITVLVPGFNADDVKVESKTKVSSDGRTYIQLKVTAETDNKYTKHIMKKEYVRTFYLVGTVEKLNYIVENGVCYVFVKTKKPAAEKPIEVQKAGKDFEWN